MGDEAQYLSDTVGVDYTAYKDCLKRDLQAESERRAMQRMMPREVRGQIANLENDLKQARESFDYWRFCAEAAEAALAAQEGD